MLHRIYADVLSQIPPGALEVYGSRLVSLAVFGSVGRGTPRFDSDIDLLVVAEGLGRGRVIRVEEFAGVEKRLAPVLERAAAAGVRTLLAPVIKTPAEVRQGSLLFLDLVEDARLLYDRDDFLARFLEDLRLRLQALGAQRLRRGGAWYWVLKENYRPGETFEV